MLVEVRLACSCSGHEKSTFLQEIQDLWLFFRIAMHTMWARLLLLIVDT